MFGMPEKLTPEMEKMVLDAMRTQVPALRTQAQYQAFMAAFDAFRFKMNAIFASDPAKEAEATKTLETAFDVARKMTEITEKLREVPEAAQGAAASMFTQAPSQLQEHDIQKALLSELEKCESPQELNDWYQATPTKERRDRIVSQPLRNAFFDAVRAKQNAFTKG